MNDDWTPEMAERFARSEGIALGEKHWCFISTSREVIARSGCAPSLPELSAMCGVSASELRSLFPGEAGELLARLASAPELERSHA